MAIKLDLRQVLALGNGYIKTSEGGQADSGGRDFQECNLEKYEWRRKGKSDGGLEVPRLEVGTGMETAADRTGLLIFSHQK